MTFRNDGDLSGGDVSGGGGGGRGLAVGGGVGGLLIVVIGALLGIDPGLLGVGGDDGGGAQSSSAQQIDERLARCTTEPGLANSDTLCRIKATTLSLDDVWTAQLPAQTRHRYTQPGTTIFSGSVSTGCGAATADVGPFYCPTDRRVYLDPDFFDSVLERQLGGSAAPAAQEYVVAHEFGHHVQNLLGDISRSQQDPKGASSGSVRVELQADCYAGLWFHFATTTPARGDSRPLLASLTAQDVDDVITTATAIGDDHIQRVGGSRVDPRSWTHGSSDMRRQWFTTGYEQGSVASCDTFGATL